MRTLLGNGQPGRLREIEARVDKHEALVNRASGIGALVAALLTLLHLGIEYLKAGN
ncbi:MAG: hypothetical protein L0212_11400 [Acidobacteria bacterium]|nr:hypothetical protein [Acidobacteriota bacterium]